MLAVGLFAAPTASAGLSARAVYSGPSSNFNCVVSTTDTGHCWGENTNGQLGDNGTTNSSTPGQISQSVSSFLSGIDAMSLGSNFACALMLDTTVKCWGGGGSGRLGNNSDTGSGYPITVLGPTGTGTLSGVTQLASGTSFNCALMADTGVKCWGYGLNGRLGNNSTATKKVPTAVRNTTDTADFTGAKEIFAGANQACLRLADNTAMCWGQNTYGQVGDGTKTDKWLPTTVIDSDGEGPLENVDFISPGNNFACALLNGGTVKCWGQDYYGQLGDGASTDQPYGVSVKAPASESGVLTGVKQISAGDSFVCSVRSTETVWCWGRNNNGQLGNGNTTTSRVPVQVKADQNGNPLTDVVEVFSGKEHACAVKRGGTIACWGRGDSGQMGDGTTTLTNLLPHTPSGFVPGPQVTNFVPLGASSTNLTELKFRIEFNVPVTGLGTDDFVLGGSSTGWKVAKVEVNTDSSRSNSYIITVQPAAANSEPTTGTVGLSVNEDAVTNSDGTAGPVGGGESTTIDFSRWSVAAATLSPTAAQIGVHTTLKGRGGAVTGAVGIDKVERIWQRVYTTLERGTETISEASPGKSNHWTVGDDLGYSIRFGIRVTTTEGLTKEVWSPLSGMVVPTVRTNPTADAGAGRNNPVKNGTLTARGAYFDGWSGGPARGYVWQRCSTASASSCSTISGATGVQYKATSDDVGSRLRVLVTLTARADHALKSFSVTATSAITGVVAAR